MRFTTVLRLYPRTRLTLLKNELSKPLWEYAPGQIAGKPTNHQGPPTKGRYEREYDSIATPRLAPHLGILCIIMSLWPVFKINLDPSCSLAGIPRDIEHQGYVSCGKYAPAGGYEDDERTLSKDLERFRDQYWIQLERRRCGGSPQVNQNRGKYSQAT